jgi:cell wall-associated NlpC family hydrolase
VCCLGLLVGDQLAALNSRAMDLNAQYERVNFELHQAESDVAAAKTLSAQTSAEADKRRADLRNYAVVAYQSGNDSPEFDALITNDAETGVRKRSYLQTISGSRQDLVDALNAASQKADEDAVRLKASQDAVASRAAEIEQTRVAADQAAAEEQAVNAKVQGELKVLVDQETTRRAAEQAAAQASARAAAAAAAATNGGTTGTTGGTSNAGRTGSGGVVGVVNPPAPGHGASGAIAAGMTKMNAPYVWGAAGPDVFDCSGFTSWAYAQVGISLSHYSGAQYNETVRISASQLQPGDLVFWGPGGSEHVAIYIGGNQLLHTAHGVAITPMDGWWYPPTGYGRITG